MGTKKIIGVLTKWRNRFIFYLMLTIVYPMGMKNNVESYMNLCLHFMNNENSFELKIL